MTSIKLFENLCLNNQNYLEKYLYDTTKTNSIHNGETDENICKMVESLITKYKHIDIPSNNNMCMQFILDVTKFVLLNVLDKDIYIKQDEEQVDRYDFEEPNKDVL